VTEPPLTPEMRFVLTWLAFGGELWLHQFGQQEDVTLHYGSAMQLLDRTTFYELFREGLIRPLGVGRSATRFGLTQRGRERLREV
jgi:hypothetical protein